MLWSDLRDDPSDGASQRQRLHRVGWVIATAAVLTVLLLHPY